MAKKIVTVALDPATLEVHCNPEPVVVKKGDGIQWKSDHGDIHGHFLLNAPVVERAWSSVKGQASPNAVVTGNPGTYKYSISLVTGSTIHTKDPEVRVDP